MRLILTALAGVAAIGIAALASPRPALAATGSEAPRVIKEACGDEAEPDCVARLRKVCRKVTLRCYYAHKRRIDEADGPDTPEKADERDDRSIFYDE